LERNHHTPSWYAVRVRGGREKLCANALRGKGFEEFLPLSVEQRRWSDRMRQVETPLFPGYVFCRFSPAARLPILTIPSVVEIVGTNKTPTPIDEKEILDIKAVVRAGMKAEPHPYLTVGQTVTVHNGPIRGVSGILVKEKKNDRLIVSLRLLQRAVAIEVDRRWVAPGEDTEITRSGPH
jgi:transcription antitermination factor NusG